MFRKLADGQATDEVDRIVEQKMLRAGEEEQREINSGIYAFAIEPLFANIDKLTTDNRAGSSISPTWRRFCGKRGHKVLALRAA